MGFKNLDLNANEYILMSGAANKMQLFGSKGGWLFLTNQRIVFKAHAFNFGSKIDEYRLSDIQNPASIRSTSYMVSNNISFATKSGEYLSFVVTRKDTDEWIYQITQAVNSLNK